MAWCEWRRRYTHMGQTPVNIQCIIPTLRALYAFRVYRRFYRTVGRLILRRLGGRLLLVEGDYRLGGLDGLDSGLGWAGWYTPCSVRSSLLATRPRERCFSVQTERTTVSEIGMLVSRVIESWSPPYLPQEPSYILSQYHVPLRLLKDDRERLLALRQLLQGDYIEEIYNVTVERGGDAVQYGAMLQVLDIQCSDWMLVR